MRVAVLASGSGTILDAMLEVGVPNALEGNVNVLRALYVRGSNGAVVPLSAVTRPRPR